MREPVLLISLPLPLQTHQKMPAPRTTRPVSCRPALPTIDEKRPYKTDEEVMEDEIDTTSRLVQTLLVDASLTLCAYILYVSCQLSSALGDILKHA